MDDDTTFRFNIAKTNYKLQTGRSINGESRSDLGYGGHRTILGTSGRDFGSFQPISEGHTSCGNTSLYKVLFLPVFRSIAAGFAPLSDLGVKNAYQKCSNYFKT